MGKKDTSLFNRLDAKPTFAMMHVCPLGEHVWRRYEGDELVEEIIQVIDQEACEAMAASYPLDQPNSRIDVDHESMDIGKRTAAVGWGKKAVVQDDGLWVEIDWNPEGRALIADKIYRFNSPVFPRSGMVPLGGNRYRVTKLSTIALTNDPNLRGQTPLTNRRAQAADPNPNPTHKANMDYKAELLKLLGLPAEATDEQIANGCASMGPKAQEKMTAMSNRVAEMETQLANSDLDAHGITDVAQRKLFTSLLTNSATRPAALATLGQIKGRTMTAPAAIHNRQGAPVPNTTTTLNQGAEDEPEKAAAKVKAEWIGNRARNLRITANLRHQDSFTQAEAEWNAKHPAK